MLGPVRRLDPGEVSAELARWLLLFLLPTLAFKLLYLTEVFGSSGGALRIGLYAILDSMGGGSGWIGRLLRLARFLTIDVLEVTLAVGALYVVLRMVAPKARDWVLASVLFLALVVVALNVICVRQLGALLSADTLSIALDWTKDHPGVLREFLSAPKLAFLAGALVWSAAPIVLPRLPSVAPLWQRAQRSTARYVLAAALVGSFVGVATRLSMTASAPVAFGGVWSSAVASLRGAADPGPCVEPPGSRDGVAARYRRLAFPDLPEAAPPAPIAVPSGAASPRHVIVVVLETAARKYYPLVDDPTLPTFRRMERSAIVGERHYTTVPFTKTAIYSIVTGTYPRAGKGIQGFGDFESDSLPTVLARHGYDTSFVDSYKIDWRPRLDDRRMWHDLGFASLLDDASEAVAHEKASFETLAESERRSFSKALDAVLGAHARGRKAFVLVATTIGHFEWKAREADRDLPAAAKLHGIAALFDDLLADLLARLDERGLGKDVLVVVTGDHGLRYGAEFASVGEKPEHGDVEFQVPLLLYAPGLVDGTVRVPYVTSHVDVAPTVLALLGLEDPTFLHHGSSMLDARLAERVTFLRDVNLSPVGGLHFKGFHYTVNHLTGAVAAKADLAGVVGSMRLSSDAVKAALEEAERVFDGTACVFLQRASRAPAR